MKKIKEFFRFGKFIKLNTHTSIFSNYNKVYKKYIYNLPKVNILIGVYILLIINIIIIQIMDNIELGIIGFIIGAIIISYFRIDSRFLVLPVIILLGFNLFLTLKKEDKLIEIITIYTFYFLIGCAIVIAREIKENKSLELYFEKSFEKFINKYITLNLLKIICFITLVITLLNIFIDLETLKNSALYLVIITLIIIGWSKLSMRNLIVQK